MPIICQSKDTPPRRHDNCFDEGEPNRIVHVAFVKKGTTISLASDTAFKSDILAAELAGNATIIRSVTGQKAAPSVKTAPGAGFKAQRL
jgi:hypothetical protein